jgi:site-specific DNA recombinase
MSLASIGDTTKIDDQERLCRLTADRLGWEVRGVYQDNNRSAWKHDRKRPAWDRMLADIGAGKINGIVVYHGDRLIRQPLDLELLIGLSRTKGIKLASPTGVRDLNNDEDQFVLGIEANMARRESANTSRRRKAQYARWRREGRVRGGGRGGRPFGFDTRGMDQVPAECELIREAAARVLAGEGISAICRDWAARGVVTVTGIPFGHGTLRKLLARPRYAGLMPDGMSPAGWLPVLDRATWELTRVMLDSRAAGYGYATNTRKHLLSGIARCGAPGCGAPLAFKASRGRGDGRYQAGYACVRPGCRKVWRDETHLDAYVSRRTVNRLNDPRNPEPRAPDTPGLAAEFAALTRALRETDDALADHTRGAVPALLARREGIERRLGELRELSAADVSARLRATYRGITWEEFGALPLPVRRSLVVACFRIVVLPASKRGPGFRPEDILMSPL